MNTSVGREVASASRRVDSRGAMRGRARTRRETILEGMVASCGGVGVLTTAAILGVLAVESVHFFERVSLSEFVGGAVWAPLGSAPSFGVWPLVCGTLLVSAIALVVALPFGLLSAVYLHEFAPRWVRAMLEPGLRLLAGIPTLAYGMLALLVVTPSLQNAIPSLAGFNALSPGLVLGVMVIPLVFAVIEDALRGVPTGVREAAFGLGATRFATVFRVVLPGAASGIAASALLASSRVIGETMIIAIAAGQVATLTYDVRGPVQTLSSYILQISTGDVAHDAFRYQSIFAVGACLYLVTLVLNVLSQRLLRRQGTR